MQLIQGAQIAKNIETDLAQEILKLPGQKPSLAFIRIGNDPASEVYIQIKKKKCQELGISSIDCELKEKVSKEEVIDLLQKLNEDPNVNGILLQLPIPPHLSPFTLIEQIDPRKDVDGFHPLNMGKLLLGEKGGLIPCTPQGIQRLLIDSDIQIEGKHVVIIGRSNIVGKPLAALLMQKDPLCNATVTIAHSQSKNLPSLCREADILIAALGKPRSITQDMVKQNAVVIDVGIHRLSTNTLCGDVDFEKVAPLCSHITPVPGGVGPMTVACLMKNTLEAYKKYHS